MTKNIALEKGVYGLKAVITAAWSENTTRYLIDNKVVELELNEGKGWSGDDLSFLAELPQLLAFTILDFTISSIKPIHWLTNLRKIDISTYCKTEIHFPSFPELLECSLEWRRGSASLFDSTQLERLFVNRYSSKSSEPFSRLTNLKALGVLNAPLENIHGLSALHSLRSLRLGNLRLLTSLSGIEGLAELEELTVQTCRRIGSINEVAGLLNLRILNLRNCGDIESLVPINPLTHLEWVNFPESTNILDGDLSPLIRAKKLSRVAFQNRKHYSHRREDIE